MNGYDRAVWSVITVFVIVLMYAVLSGCATPRTFSVMCFEDLETGSYVCTTSIPAERVPEIVPASAK